MVAPLPAIRLTRISGRKKTAFLRRAKELGLTPEDYVQHLIDADLRVDQQARAKPLRELAAPFTKALKGLSSDALDQLVDEARRSERGAKNRWR